MGFRHWDLRLGNIMEHHPSRQGRSRGQQGDSDGMAEGKARAGGGVEVQAETQGGGDSPSAASGAVELQPRCSKKGVLHSAAVPPASGQHWAENQGLQAGDCIWKIIDFGHADFDDRDLLDDGVCLEGPRSKAEEGWARLSCLDLIHYSWPVSSLLNAVLRVVSA